MKILVIAAAGAIAATIFLAYVMDQDSKYGEVPCPPENLSGNGASAMTVGFSTLEEIVTNSDAIVIAEVSKCVKFHSHPKAKDIRLTDFELTIERSIMGDLPSGGSIIVQLVTSGEDAEVHLMREDERYVLFLTYNQITSGYAPVGGPQGRFIIVDEFVYSLDNIHPELGFINVKVDGQPLDSFLSDVNSVSSQ